MTKMLKNVHKLQENFYKCKMEEAKNIEDFHGWLEIIIKQLKGMNNNSFDELAMITNIMHV
jgi:hypothetical protein